MPVRIRRAEEADIPFLAGVAIAAARSHVERGLFDLLIPDDADARQAFAEALLRARPSWCHWQNFHLAEVDGEPAAALSGYPIGDVDLAPPEQVLPEVARSQGFSDDELAAGTATLRDLDSGDQSDVALDSLSAALEEFR